MSKTDAAFRSFLEACIAGTAKCVLSRQGTSADELEAKVYDLLDTIKRQPLALGTNINDVVRYDVLKTNILTGLRAPSTRGTGTWPLLAEMLSGVFTRNLTAYQDAAAILGGFVTSKTWPDQGLDGAAGIRCSDHGFRTNNLPELLPIIDRFEATSQIAGPITAAAQPMTCAQWPFEAKERIQWTGGYRTRNPILLVGNTFDPLTPVESAFNTSADFPGSAVVQQNTGGVSGLPILIAHDRSD